MKCCHWKDNELDGKGGIFLATEKCNEIHVNGYVQHINQ